jgi:16S rRNA processing protein RimM
VSPSNADWIAVALLGRTRGNRGEITAVALSSKLERYESLREVYLFRGDANAGKYDVESTWFHDSTLIFKFRGIDSISDAEPLNGAEVRIPFAERVTLDPDEFFESDILGCEVIDRQTGESLGRVSAWTDGGAAGILEVGDLMIPFARSICVEIDPAHKRIAVELPPGLKDINRQ